MFTRVYEGFVNTVSRAVLNYTVTEIEAAADAIEAANNTLHEGGDWKKFQMPYFRLSYEIMVQTALAWKEFRVASMSKGIEAMQAASLFQSKSWHPEAGHLWDAHEQLAEMYMIR